ncbi:hypothetical protein VmeM32_00151 [Vibrio phage vB_VmeM-32]|nr:hypothetical protein VmeM32_00151 [Vibrio phage vB_VmeM-32]
MKLSNIILITTSLFAATSMATEIDVTQTKAFEEIRLIDTKIDENKTQWSVHFGGWSHHVKTNDFEYNETHNMKIVQRNNILFGEFTNSFGNRTYVVGYDLVLTNKHDFQFGLIGGLVHGYKNDAVKSWNYNVMPIVVPYVTYTKYDIQPSVSLMGNAFVFSIKYQF